MRHLASFAALIGAVVLTAAALDRLAARSPAPGQLWVLTRGPAGPAMARIASQVGGRVLDAPAGGRVLVLQVDALSAPWPAAGDAWFVLRLPAVLAVAPACG